MQKQKEITQLIPIIFVLALVACRKDPFDALIERSRDGEIAAVAVPRSGVPFYSAGTLNPVWDEKASISRMGPMSLQDQNGKTRDESLFKGKISLVGFFFASCRGFCPALVRNIRQIADELKGKADAQIVLLTVDPEHDTPKTLAEYAKKNKLAGWTLLTGDQSKIYSIARDTFVNQAFRRDDDGGERNFVHSENVYVIDQELRLRAVINANRVGSEKEALAVVSELASRSGTTQASR